MEVTPRYSEIEAEKEEEEEEDDEEEEVTYV